MMLKVSCLVKNTQLQEDLKDLIQYSAYSRIAQDKSASIGSIYNDIRKSGIEVDLQTVGYLYNEVLSKDVQQISSDKEVNDFVGATYKDAVTRASKLEDKQGEDQIGKDSVEVHVVNGILNMFTSTYAADKRTQSDLLTMQKALWNGIQRRLSLPKDTSQPATKTAWKDIIGKAIGYEQLGVTDVNGRLNGIRDLYAAMKLQLNEAARTIRREGDFATADKWDEMVKQLEAATYNLLFSTNDAKKVLVDMMKEAGFGKKVKNGDIVLDWNKLAGGINSVQSVRDNVQSVLEKNGYDAAVIEGIKNSLENEFQEFTTNVLQHSLKELNKRQDALDREHSTKSDLRRLSELNNYGIFNRAHDRLLYDMLGVTDLQQADINDLKALSEAASNLYREVDKTYGSDVFASFAFQNLQNGINSIISRNVNNKTGMLKAINVANNFMSVFLTGLLANPFNILENAYSGVKEVLVPSLTGKRKLSKQDRNLYWRVISDVVSRGVPFGEEVGSFAPREVYLNNVKWKWNKDASAKEKANSIIYALTLPARFGLLALDSANKATSTNKIFNNAVYKALIQKGGKSHEEAILIMNEALYGQKFEDAQEEAEKMLDRVNKGLPDKYKTPINKNTIARLANDLVKANLINQGEINSDFIDAAIKSSYHVAGKGLGHNPNNPLSKAIKSYRNERAKKQDKLVEQKRWNEVAIHRAVDSFINNFVIKFTGGATNWIYLKLQSDTPLGIVAGVLGKWKGDIDFKDRDSIKESIEERESARNSIGRSVIGLSATAIALTIAAALNADEDDEDKERRKELLELEKNGFLTKYQKETYNTAKKNEIKAKLKEELDGLQTGESVMKSIQKGYMGKRLFLKTAPSALVLWYYLDTDKNKFQAVADFVIRTGGMSNDFSASKKISDASKMYMKGQIDAGNGALASIVGESVGVPLFKPYKEFYRVGKWLWPGGDEVNSDFKKPSNFSDGLFGGGFLEAVGAYKRNPPITMLPGIGTAKYELFRERGIENMDDLQKNENWFSLKHRSESGENVFILSPTEQKKAKQAYKEYLEQK